MATEGGSATLPLLGAEATLRLDWEVFHGHRTHSKSEVKVVAVEVGRSR
jgi:hypothetical protein